MFTPAMQASRTSDPAVIMLKAFATQVSPAASFDRFALAAATTTGLTPREITCSEPKPLDASTPAVVPAATNSRRVISLPVGFFIMAKFCTECVPPGRKVCASVPLCLRSIPLRFPGGVASAINKKIPFLSGADGVVSKSQQNKVRYADIYKEATRPFTNHPVCAAEERVFLLRRSHPSLKNGGEWGRLAN